MLHILEHTVIDTLKILPLLLLVYLFFEYVEYKYENKVKQLIEKYAAIGPVLGAIFGCIPQCGFSVIVTVLYTQRAVSLGTLVATYISTSDETLPILLSQPTAENTSLTFQIIIIKLIAAIIIGFLIDLVYRFFFKSSKIIPHDPNCECVTHNHCCGHKHEENGRPASIEMIIRAFKHSCSVLLFIFILLLIFNSLFEIIGEDRIAAFIQNSSLEMTATILIGLIPSCSTSVVIIESLLTGVLSFPATIAGLSANSGLGLLALYKESKNKIEIFYVILLLAACSALIGSVVSFIK